jgi:Na+:H+ antiporter, NhaA family
MESKYRLSPLQRIAQIEGLGGIMLLAATVLAIFWANSPWGDVYESIWQYKIGIDADTFHLKKPLILWINDGLMAIFFFLIGLEIKRELVIGELNTPKKAALPIFAAVGGMILPVTFYILINKNPEAVSGWGIPMATDIAFSLAILNALGKRVPIAIKVFLTAFAIIDDLGAVVIIALFYSEDLHTNLLLISAIPLLLLFIANRFNYYSKFVWIVLGITIWVLFLKGGIHPTIAGVILAFTIPLKRKIEVKDYCKKLSDLTRRLDESGAADATILSHEQAEQIHELERSTREVQSRLQEQEHKLHGLVTYFILPLFALSNAGVVFNMDLGLDWHVAMTIAVSLFFGKFLGIPLFTYIGLKLKLTELPAGIKFSTVIGVGFLAGVGFTMAIFIANLAFAGQPLLTNSAKIGILIGSFSAGIIGYIVMRIDSRQYSVKAKQEKK